MIWAGRTVFRKLMTELASKCSQPRAEMTMMSMGKTLNSR